MANSYYTHTDVFVAGQQAKHAPVDGEFEKVETGLAAAEADIGKSIRGPDAMSAMTETAANRANKLVAFDSSGNPTADDPVGFVGGTVGQRIVKQSSTAQDANWGAGSVAVSASKTLALSDHKTVNIVTGTGSNITITVPANATVALPNGFEVTVFFKSFTSAERCLIDLAAGVSDGFVGNYSTVSGETEYEVLPGSAIRLTKIATDSWVSTVLGDLPSRYETVMPDLAAETDQDFRPEHASISLASSSWAAGNSDAALTYFHVRKPTRVTGISVQVNTTGGGTAKAAIYQLDGSTSGLGKLPSTRVFSSSSDISLSSSSRQNISFTEGTKWLMPGSYALYIVVSSGGSGTLLRAIPNGTDTVSYGHANAGVQISITHTLATPTTYTYTTPDPWVDMGGTWASATGTFLAHPHEEIKLATSEAMLDGVYLMTA